MIKLLEVIKKGRKIYYKLACCTWNWFLNKYYPKAVKILEIDVLK